MDALHLAIERTINFTQHLFPRYAAYHLVIALCKPEDSRGYAHDPAENRTFSGIRLPCIPFIQGIQQQAENFSVHLYSLCSTHLVGL
jgi:hypothetical protein